MRRKSHKNKKPRLPYGYATMVVKDLEEQGITLKKQAIYDCVNGRKKDTELTVKVWSAIKKIVSKNKKLMAKVAAVKMVD